MITSMHKCLGMLFANEWTSPSKLYERDVCWKQFDVEHALNCREETVITKWHNGMWSIKVKCLPEVTNAIELNIIIAGFIFIYLLFIYLFIYLFIHSFIYLLGFTPWNAEQPIRGIELQEKEAQKG